MQRTNKKLTIEELEDSFEEQIELIKSGEIEAIYLTNEHTVLLPIDQYELYINEVNIAKYQSNEIVSLQTFKHNSAYILNKLRANKIDKVAIIYEDKLMLIVMRLAEYEQAKELFKGRDTLDISKIIEERIGKFGEVVRCSKEDIEELLKDQLECL
ncbi:hypothetical protein JHD46_05245 [Sulfurimonas sp. SAG-AH-194-C20]|nr:hypothetical protein [Sulfurimonas sp. SAG-AH-194-C20]MDF1879044.1 hypothetical protein [Sulfurimonas sp. SAG-AH-194-C20]